MRAKKQSVTLQQTLLDSCSVSVCRPHSSSPATPSVPLRSKSVVVARLGRLGIRGIAVIIDLRSLWRRLRTQNPKSSSFRFPKCAAITSSRTLNFGGLMELPARPQILILVEAKKSDTGTSKVVELALVDFISTS
ncbi:unnamed protein product [Microthlaspi erraticum]|uniref:Uncharacterized protein n=1 Tax=Microthlaspi erraticum TaxID=1685480 RepID=A0A6D2L506_9BRAS|nr:unnamed protein product [Microthlaspi erraticum]